MTQQSPRPWNTLGSVDPRQLVEARLQLHWAVQLVAAFSNAGLETLPDDSQSNLGWQDGPGVLQGRVRPDGFAAGLKPVDLELVLIDAAGGIVDGMALAGRTLEEGRTWLDSAAARGDGSSPITLRDYEMPDHPVAAGNPFTHQPTAAFAAVAQWFAAGNSALSALTASQPGWAEVRCWPHHFDLGTIASLEASNDPSSGRSIGAGMSTGDASYAEPYFYVNPYGLRSQPAGPPDLPPPALWHTEGWFGAVLMGSALLAHKDPSSTVAGFFDGAVAAARQLLGA